MTSNNPLVSIIIPTYNRGHLIGETLDSILAQTYQNWECLVVDDDSNDNTPTLVASYTEKDLRFKYFQRPSNKPKGANACRNYGFQKCRGDYIQWFDSDDLMHPEMLTRKIYYALHFDAAVVVATHRGQLMPNLLDEPAIETFESSAFYIDYILGFKQVITNDVMLKRSIIGSMQFDEQLHKAQEFEFFSRIFEQNLRYCFIDLPLSVKRETADSISKQTGKGNVKQVESLIYLSKKLQERHGQDALIIERAKRQGRKTYKSLAIRKEIGLIFKYFNFFKKAHNKTSLLFFCYIMYNLITARGFDAIKPKEK